MLNLSEALIKEIKSYALNNKITPRELAIMLKGELRLLPKDMLAGLPQWAGSLKQTDFTAIFNLTSKILAGDPEYFLAEGEKLVSFLNQDIESAIPLSGVQLKKVKKAIGDNIFSLIINMLPEKHESRMLIKNPSGLIKGEIATITGRVMSWKRPWSNKAPWVMDMDFGDNAANSRVSVSFFGKVGAGYAAQFPEASEIIVSGELSTRTMLPSFTNPDIFKHDEVWKELLSGFVPVYKKITGVSQLFLLRAVREAILRLMKFRGDWLPDIIRGKYGFPDLISSVINIHFPAIDIDKDELNEKETAFHRRLAFDKIFFFQYAYRKQKAAAANKRRTVKINSTLAIKVEKELPFALTNAQKRALAGIRADLKSKEPMSRLLQGDVGSGKTVIMLLAGLDVASSGYKTVIMAPTEILARQHYETISKFTGGSAIKSELVLGGVTGKKKKEARNQLVSEADFIIGTHALYENLEQLKNLGLVIVDEQHRFGVSQRMELMSKGNMPDVLVASATPIPRSLALTMYGGVEISVLNEMPAGRTPVKTRFVPYDNRQVVADHIVSIIEKENKTGYWVCPLVEGSDKLDATDVTTVYEEFKARIGDRAQLLHGRMKVDEKDRILGMLRSGEANILISTVVIEVGIDIPEASFMVIENAERFGLAQLHQLRGRVGRGAVKSFAAFIAGRDITEKAQARLNFMQGTNDGFKIAEYDLKLRGPGALTGYEQSGFANDPYYLIAAQYGIEVQKAQTAAKKVWTENILDSREKAFLDRVFDSFFKSSFEKYRIG